MLTIEKAEELLMEAKRMNDGPWLEHSKNVADLARRIAKKADMNSQKAYIMGLMHDIGRRNGAMQTRHALEGYKYLMEMYMIYFEEVKLQ